MSNPIGNLEQISVGDDILSGPIRNNFQTIKDKHNANDAVILSQDSRITVVENNSFTSRLFQQQIVERIKAAVTASANIKRLVFFDGTDASSALKDRSVNAKDIILSKTANLLTPAIAGNARILNFGSSDTWEFDDADDLSFGNGTTETGFSLLVLARPGATSNHRLISKESRVTGAEQREYNLCFYSNNLHFEKNDNSYLSRRAVYCNTDYSSDVNAFQSYVVTDSGSATNANMKIYRNGVALTTVSDDLGASYTAMENNTAKVGNYRTGPGGTKDLIGAGSYCLVAIFSEVLTATAIKQLDAYLRAYVGIDSIALV